MASHLVPCPDCDRHVRIIEAVCPFCGETLPASLRNRVAPPLPTQRLGRAARFAFGAVAAGALATTACSSDDGRGPRTDSGVIGIDSGGTTGDSGPAMDSGGPTLDDGGPVALYGGPPPEDAAVPPTDAGRPTDAGGPRDSGGTMALYGAAPPDGGAA